MINCGGRSVPVIARHINGKAVDYKNAAYAGVRSCNDSTVRRRVTCKSIRMARVSEDSVCSIPPFEIQMARASKDSIRSNRPFEDRCRSPNLSPDWCFWILKSLGYCLPNVG